MGGRVPGEENPAVVVHTYTLGVGGKSLVERNVATAPNFLFFEAGSESQNIDRNRRKMSLAIQTGDLRPPIFGISVVLESNSLQKARN